VPVPPDPENFPSSGAGGEALAAAQAERDALRVEVERLTADSEALREDVRRLEVERDTLRTDAQHWRAETARLVAAEQRRLGSRLKQARYLYGRRAWRLLPADTRNRLRPLIYRRQEFIGPEPLQEDDAPRERRPARPPEERRQSQAGTQRHPARDGTSRKAIDVPVSVVVPTFNAGSDAALFLAAIERQVGVPELELVVADSGSTDGTRERFAAAADVLLDIPPGEFGHGRTRNEAFAASSGEVVVMLVQDALLLGRHALHDLVHEVLSDDGLAAVSGRQVPRSDADLYGAFNVVSHYNALWRDGRRAKPNDPLHRRAAAGVDNVCAAIRSATWEQGIQYRDVEFGEDFDFGIRALEAGWRIALSDHFAVAHSHNRDAVYHFRRNVAERLNIAPLAGTAVGRAASAGGVAEIAAAGRALLGDLAASLAVLPRDSPRRLSLLLEHVAVSVLDPVTTMEPSGGPFGEIAELLFELANGAQGVAVSQPLRQEFARLLGWPYLLEFADAQRAASFEAAGDFLAKLAASVIGRSIGDALRVDSSPGDRERLLVGV
jgi:rhamnosyltransferase